MSIKLVHLSDIHFGSGEINGQTNPLTGLNTRFEDFVASLDKVIDFSLNNQVDCVIFAGDAYKNSTPEPIYQKHFAKFIAQLANNDIQMVLLVGNHDQIIKSNQSHSMSVFDSLELPNVHVIDFPQLKIIQTRNGSFQLIGIPHMTKNMLNINIDVSNSNLAQIDELMIQEVSSILNGLYQKLDSELPAVVTAHMTLDKAVSGIEQELLLGYNLTYPSSIFQNSNVDYVALGHVHKHQVVQRSNPAIIYCGSVDRVDFGEQAEEKGFMEISLVRHSTTYQFHSLNTRPFLTIELDLTNVSDIDQYIENTFKYYDIENKVVRLKYKINSQDVNKLKSEKLKEFLSKAFHFRIIPEIKPNMSKVRVASLKDYSMMSPKQTLINYLQDTLNCEQDQINKYLDIIKELE